jgi:hypothetical protein
MMIVSCDEIDDPIETGTEQDADIVAFSFDGIDGKATIDKAAHTVSAKANETVDLTAIVADFTLSTGATATVDGKSQTSRQTANNFSAPVTYSITSGDGLTKYEWTVTVTGGKTGSGQGGAFTKRTFKTVREVIDFFPQGVYVYEHENKSWNNDIELYAKAADGSFTFSEMEGDPKRSDYGETDNWHVWKGESYHSINYTNDSKEKITRWWQVQADYPGENLLQSEDTKYGYGMKSISVSTPWGGIPTAQPGENIDVFSLFMSGITPWMSFIISDDCEKAVFDGNTTVEGIECKKYRIDVEGVTFNGVVIEEPYSKFYYVLENGFCLKKDDQNQYSMTNFTLKKAEKSAASCDEVMQKYYTDKEIYNRPVSVASMQILTHMRNGSSWAAGAAPSSNGGWVIPWTAGGIKWMSYFYELGKTAPHTINAELDMTKFTDADRAAYIAKVKNIPLMKVKSDSDQTIEGYRIALFESNNDDDSWDDNLTFGDSYYYIKYNLPLTSYGASSSAAVHIIWVKVTIV